MKFSKTSASRMPAAESNKGIGRLPAPARNPGGLSEAIGQYFAGDLTVIDKIPTKTNGTAFQRQVWQALREIPVGSTASYADIAQRIGSPKAVRAVAQACGANYLAVAIPCHRVLRNDGALSGYRWGVERKRALLGREGVAP